MSRYPWEEYVNRYLSSMQGIWADTTRKAMHRRYRRTGQDIRTAFDSGMISTSSPRTMTPEDVRHHLVYRKSLGLS